MDITNTLGRFDYGYKCEAVGKNIQDNIHQISKDGKVIFKGTPAEIEAFIKGFLYLAESNDELQRAVYNSKEMCVVGNIFDVEHIVEKIGCSQKIAKDFIMNGNFDSNEAILEEADENLNILFDIYKTEKETWGYYLLLRQ